MIGHRLALVLLTTALAAPCAPPPLTTLQPGAFRDIAQTLDVNIVFLGYVPGGGPRDINEAAMRAVLPATYRPIHRYPDFYGIRQYVGLTFGFNYRVTYAPQTYADAFFGYLSSIAVPQPRTLFQDAYNSQPPRAATVGQNHWIDPTLVEKWLAANAIAGVDTTKYTIFFINWHGRADFKYHVYAKTDEPDADTGYNFGAGRASRKVIAWGGTTPDDPQSGLGALGVRRIWFFDLSAGPESWTGNYDIMNADVDGDGSADYRMPPIWEYGNASAGLYRPFDNLSADLGKIARYVGINLLFTTSPLYKPSISPPRLPRTVQVDVNVYNGEPGFDGKTFFKTNRISQTLGALQPGNAISTQVSDASFKSRALDVYKCFVFGPSCYGNRLFGISFGDLFLFHRDHLMPYLEGDGDYEVPVFSYNTTDALGAGGLLGFADDNWADGTQSFVFQFQSPAIRMLGYGNTSTAIHEVGHHLGMSHPHDGFDYEQNLDYGAVGAFYYAWAGDESNSVMNYLSINDDFSQFDRDNMSRFRTAGYINQANAILPKILASPRSEAAYASLLAADADAAAALVLHAAMDYDGAALRAQSAYEKVLAGAAQANVKIETQAWQSDYKAKGRSPKFVDAIDYHRNMP